MDLTLDLPNFNPFAKLLVLIKALYLAHHIRPLSNLRARFPPVAFLALPMEAEK